jgi:dipeptidyl aminopeptidase/acylaminoacyl peptidase
MERDIRNSPLYQEAEELHRILRQPGTGNISDAADVAVSPDGRTAVFSATIVDELCGVPPTRIASIDLESGDVRVMTSGPNNDRLPRFSPDGRQIAFLSDRGRIGDFQLYLLDPTSGAVRAVGPANGWVEFLQWSPDGTRILIGVAGDGADVAGGQGAITRKINSGAISSWMPLVEDGTEGYRRREAWIYHLATDAMQKLNTGQNNVWDAVWCGNEAVAAVVSIGPTEGDWYETHVALIKIKSGGCHRIFAPRDQLGCLAASPSGSHVAIVEAVSSDRGITAGDLRVIDTRSGYIDNFDTGSVDVSCVEWRPDDRLLLAGHRGFETVVGVCDPAARTFTEVWRSETHTTGGVCASVAAIADTDDCVLAGEGFLDAPEIAIIRGGTYQPLKSFGPRYREVAQPIATVEPTSWIAPDGIDLQGWLLRPEGTGQFPLIMYIHGGPVGHWRPTWLGRKHVPALMLLKRGCAIFLPNPRGSLGRGQGFVRKVLGDLGGADAADCISGLDHLIACGIANPARIGISGGSYGGYMTSWLVSQSSRFAAAVSVSPATNHVTSQLLSNIPQFVEMFLGDAYTNYGGKYYTRSPIMHAAKVTTPTLNICGALDRCTPPEEAAQFHNALLQNGVISGLVMYPQEGHGVRAFPTLIDYAARVVGWFEQHIPL